MSDARKAAADLADAIGYKHTAQGIRLGWREDHPFVEAFIAFEAQIVERCCRFIEGGADAYLKSAETERGNTLAAAECKASANALRFAAMDLRSTIRESRNG